MLPALGNHRFPLISSVTLGTQSCVKMSHSYFGDQNNFIKTFIAPDGLLPDAGEGEFLSTFAFHRPASFACFFSTRHWLSLPVSHNKYNPAHCHIVKGSWKGAFSYIYLLY
jgi:hypothetical protein